MSTVNDPERTLDPSLVERALRHLDAGGGLATWRGALMKQHGAYTLFDWRHGSGAVLDEAALDLALTMAGTLLLETQLPPEPSELAAGASTGAATSASDEALEEVPTKSAVVDLPPDPPRYAAVYELVDQTGDILRWQVEGTFDDVHALLAATRELGEWRRDDECDEQGERRFVDFTAMGAVWNGADYVPPGHWPSTLERSRYWAWP